MRELYNNDPKSSSPRNHLSKAHKSPPRSLRLCAMPSLSKAHQPTRLTLLTNGFTIPQMTETPKKPILWVDDEPTVLMMVAMLLQSYDYEVTTAGSAKEALEMLKQDQSYDLIGTDIRMAECDGLEMSQTIKELYPSLKIIVLSAHASDDAQAIAEKIGVYAYIHKPFKVDNLLTVINEAIDAN
jgi:CheY-like chemotaxis protein